MGLEISYDISLPSSADVDSVLRSVTEYAGSRGFKTTTTAVGTSQTKYLGDAHVQSRFEVIQKGNATECLERHKGEWPSEAKVAAVWIHPNAPAVEIVFGRYSSGWFGFGGVKTHGAPPQTHIDVVAILDKLKELGVTTKVYDNSKYFETRDERRILVAKDLIEALLRAGQKSTIQRYAGMGMEAKVGRQALTYEAELEMTEFHWLMNDGQISQSAYLWTPLPGEASPVDDAYLDALRAHGIAWIPFQLPDIQDALRNPNHKGPTVFDLDPRNAELNDMIYFCLDVATKSAREGHLVFPMVAFRTKEKRDVKVPAQTGRYEVAVAEARKIVAGLGPDVQRYAWPFDGYITVDGVRTDCLFVEAGERGIRLAAQVAQRYVPKGDSKGFALLGQPFVVGPSSGTMPQNRDEIAKNSPYVPLEPSNPSDEEAPIQTIVVDEHHDHISGLNNPAVYRVKMTDRLVLDFIDHGFDISKLIGRPPNTAHVILRTSGAYFARFNPRDGKAELSGDNLTKFRGGAFHGFREPGMISIGWQDYEQMQKTHEVHFVPFWMSEFGIEGHEGPLWDARPAVEGSIQAPRDGDDEEAPPGTPEITDTELRELNVYFARGNRAHDMAGRISSQEGFKVANPAGKTREVVLEDLPDSPETDNQPAFIQTEALKWLENNKNKAALARSRFPVTADAIETVKRLYEAGAVRVDAVVTNLEPSRIEQEGGPYCEELEVTFPPRDREKLLEAVKSIKPDNWDMGGLRLSKTTTDSIGVEPETLWWADLPDA